MKLTVNKICNFCGSSLSNSSCRECKPNIYYVTNNNCTFYSRKNNKDTYYKYNFDSKTFKLSIYPSPYITDVLNYEFKDVSFKSSKEFVDFGDRILKFLTFI